MKYFVTGVGGQLGYDVVSELVRRGYPCVGSDLSPEYAGMCAPVAEMTYVPLDITDAASVRDTLQTHAPDVVVHCAAWTAVDAAEEDENREKVFAVNVDGTRNLAQACREIGAKMIYISTDYVFNGQGSEPWTADCEEYAPLSVYGETKLLGERAVSELLERYFIVRIAWVFGRNGKNFVRTMLNVGKKYPAVRVVCDQIGTPTYTEDLARLLADMARSEKYGTYHATNEGGFISWYDFTCEIFRQAGYSTQVTPVTTAEYGLSKAARPFNSRLDKSKLTESGFTPLPDWKDALARYLKQIEE